MKVFISSAIRSPASTYMASGCGMHTYNRSKQNYW